MDDNPGPHHVDSGMERKELRGEARSGGGRGSAGEGVEGVLGTAEGVHNMTM